MALGKFSTLFSLVSRKRAPEEEKPSEVRFKENLSVRILNPVLIYFQETYDLFSCLFLVLDENQEIVEKIKGQMKDWLGPHKPEEFHDSLQEFRGLWQLIGKRPVHPGTEKWSQIRDVISRARREIEDILNKD